MFEPIRFSGHVENNVVVPDEGVKLPEGAKVEVQVSEADKSTESKLQRTERIKKSHKILLQATKNFKVPSGFVFDRETANER